MSNETSSNGSEARSNGSAASHAAADAGAAMQDAARKVCAQAAEVGERVYNQAVDAGRYAGRQLEEQPWLAGAVIGAVGLALGVMLGRASVPQPRSTRDYVDDYLPRRLRRG